ncbi:hypothetical protein EPN16_07200 [bacterium]|nr:MAG: hypothetical protein EPN16_07200 [bacterium]
MRYFSRTGRNIISVFILLFICFSNSLSYAQIKYIASGQRDPFENQLPRLEPEPDVFQEPEAEIEVPEAPVVPPEITVGGIVSGGTIPQAVIQEKVVRVGDAIGGARITKITKEGVEVVYEGETFMFPAPSREVKPGQGGKNVLQ